MLKAGAPFPIGYAAYDQDATLFIRAHVFNITSGTPIVVGTVNLVHEGFGCYSNIFAGGADGDLYSICKIVYTDGTYATVETQRPPSKDEAQFVDLAASIGESIAVGDLVAVLDENEMFLAALECDES